MRYKMALMLTLFALLTACTTAMNKETDSMHVNNDTTTATPNVTSIAGDASTVDNSIRAVGTVQDGHLLVKPDSQANKAPLGAPSCLGLETFFRWSGDYEVVWEPASGGASSKVFSFPVDFDIVQPSETPILLQQFTLEKTTIFAYVPRYTDCHGLETYLFGIEEGKAFPIPFVMKPDQILAEISQLPQHPFQVSNGELILTGGYGAGQDFIPVYHFNYDRNKHAMILNKTEQVKPNDLVSGEA
ncbi:hypothetical protein [Paenibacillus qinlingensis]|uniref:Lipoprotein n=1 Tax=Paenibacillus qinlingensis TaxID=1837343 RepID=A0ABU1NNV5_9BACL|nr:hypothetical protein [Paenibacillus qinlingensis]MDR6549153.1 hypothetical protein [Paenibacillus qinlingensis]